MEEQNTATTTIGKYSSKRKQELNGINPQTRDKKNKYTEDPEEKYFKNAVYDADYYTLITYLMELLPIHFIEKIPLENDNIFKVYIRQLYNDKNYKSVRLVDFIDTFKLFVDNGTHDEKDVIYTYRTFFNILDDYIIYDNEFYLKDEVKDSCCSIMVGLHPNLHKYFFEKILAQYEVQDNLMEYVLDYDRLNKKNTTGEYLFKFTSLKELCDDISTRFHRTVIDTSKYEFHRWN
jgi:hypothetical protein